MGPRWLHTVSTIVFNVLLAAVLLVAGALLAGPRYGWGVHPVLSGSMQPALKVGGVVITRQVLAASVVPGDIITFPRENVLITHRVTSVMTEGGTLIYRTKGDANEEEDPFTVIPREGYVARVVLFVPWVGFTAGFAKSRAGFLCLVVIPGLVLAGCLIREIVREITSAGTA